MPIGTPNFSGNIVRDTVEGIIRPHAGAFEATGGFIADIVSYASSLVATYIAMAMSSPMLLVSWIPEVMNTISMRFNQFSGAV